MNSFFCFGLPKSGTTFLQMLLNQHKQVSCPSEHQFDYCFNELGKLLNGYNQVLKVTDQRTAKQGPMYMQQEDHLAVYKKMVEIGLERGAAKNVKGSGPIKWYGANDNAVINKLAFYLKLFPTSKFICIVRDPRSVAISTWHHNHRVEKDFLARAKSFEHWVVLMGKAWNKTMKSFLETQKNAKERILSIRYEDLAQQPHQFYPKLFEFLEVEMSSSELEVIIKDMSFDNFKDGQFFRSGTVDKWKEEIKGDLLQQHEKEAKEMMLYFNYEPTVN